MKKKKMITPEEANKFDEVSIDINESEELENEQCSNIE